MSFINKISVIAFVLLFGCNAKSGGQKLDNNLKKPAEAPVTQVSLEQYLKDLSDSSKRYSENSGWSKPSYLHSCIPQNLAEQREQDLIYTKVVTTAMNKRPPGNWIVYFCHHGPKMGFGYIVNPNLSHDNPRAWNSDFLGPHEIAEDIKKKTGNAKIDGVLLLSCKAGQPYVESKWMPDSHVGQVAGAEIAKELGVPVIASTTSIWVQNNVAYPADGGEWKIFESDGQTKSPSALKLPTQAPTCQIPQNLALDNSSCSADMPCREPLKLEACSEAPQPIRSGCGVEADVSPKSVKPGDTIKIKFKITWCSGGRDIHVSVPGEFTNVGKGTLSADKSSVSFPKTDSSSEGAYEVEYKISKKLSDWLDRKNCPRELGYYEDPSGGQAGPWVNINSSGYWDLIPFAVTE